MDWFQGNMKPESPMIFMGKSRWFPVFRFSLEPTHPLNNISPGFHMVEFSAWMIFPTRSWMIQHDFSR